MNKNNCDVQSIILLTSGFQSKLLSNITIIFGSIGDCNLARCTVGKHSAMCSKPAFPRITARALLSFANSDVNGAFLDLSIDKRMIALQWKEND